MSRSTKDQSYSAQPNPAQQIAPPQPDNTAIMAQLMRMTEMMNAMRGDLNAIRSDLNTVIVGTQALKRAFRPAATQQATQYSTPPAPQEAPKEEEEEEDRKPLYQATVEDVTESTAENETEHQHGSSKLSSNKPDNKSTLSSIPRLCTTPTSGDSAACLGNALLCATKHALILVNTPLGYIEHSQGMEARGEG